jgi:hypothetical protein
MPELDSCAGEDGGDPRVLLVEAGRGEDRNICVGNADCGRHLDNIYPGLHSFRPEGDCKQSGRGRTRN